MRVKKWMKRHRIALSLVPVILVMGLIFWFSAQTGEDSGALSGGLTRWILGLFVGDFDAFSPEKQEQWLSTLGMIIRKGGHFSEFALLGFSLAFHIRQIQSRYPVRLLWLWAWCIGTLYAVSDEIHQGFVGGRHPAVTDVMIDSAGVAAGAGLLVLVYLKVRK